jgi:acetate---CoA ligase (ADP-forming)
MKRGNLNSFLKPKSIAIIGASNTLGKVGYTLVEKSKNSKAKIIPINLKEKSIQELKAYSSVLNYKQKIDLAVIAIPKKFIIKVIDQCIKKKIKNIIIISAGFEEKKDSELQKKLLSRIKKNKLNVLGPNCFGITNQEINLDLTFSNKNPKKGNTIFLSQSGALFSYIADHKIKINKYISLGNMADLNFSDWIEFLNQNKKIKKIVCYIEKLKDGKKFIRVCKNSKKKIIAIKAGQTKEGKKAALSHTGSLATDYKIYQDIFKQANVLQENSLIKAFNKKPQNFQKLTKELTKKKKIKIITNAGGAAALLADKLTNQNLKISKIIDLLGTAKAQDYKKELNKKTKDQIIVILTPQSMSEPEKTAQEIINSKNKKLIRTALFLGNSSLQPAIKLLKNNKIPVFTKIL